MVPGPLPGMGGGASRHTHTHTHSWTWADRTTYSKQSWDLQETEAGALSPRPWHASKGHPLLVCCQSTCRAPGPQHNAGKPAWWEPQATCWASDQNSHVHRAYEAEGACAPSRQMCTRTCACHTAEKSSPSSCLSVGGRRGGVAGKGLFPFPGPGPAVSASGRGPSSEEVLRIC